MSKKKVLRKARPNKVHGLRAKLKYAISNFRLSLTFRIALHYCWQLLRTSIMSLLLLTMVLSGIVLAELESDIRRIRTSEPMANGMFSQADIQNYTISAHLFDTPYDNDANNIVKYRITKITIFGASPVLHVEAEHMTGRMIRMECSISHACTCWLWLMGAAVFCDVLRMIVFLRTRDKLHKTVLAPIRDITEMATTLSANNLSNRINIAGTKNELKDLAVVINSMLDRIERSYNSQKQFVSDASHELRTPIAVIQGYISMLERWGKRDPEVLDEGISAIAQETASMKDLVESLLFLARHDKKTLMMEMAQFNILELVSELHREASMVTPDDTFLLNPSDDGLIEGDRGMIKQVMRILCDNAVKYTPQGGTITLGVTHEPGWYTLSVTDNGPGIQADELPKIFERFYRSDSARKSEGGGHGLGLSIARIIVIAHGGKMRVRSKPGSGSTFYVILPEKQDKLHTATFSVTEADKT